MVEDYEGMNGGNKQSKRTKGGAVTRLGRNSNLRARPQQVYQMEGLPNWGDNQVNPPEAQNCVYPQNYAEFGSLSSPYITHPPGYQHFHGYNVPYVQDPSLLMAPAFFSNENWQHYQQGFRNIPGFYSSAAPQGWEQTGLYFKDDGEGETAPLGSTHSMSDDAARGPSGGSDDGELYDEKEDQDRPSMERFAGSNKEESAIPEFQEPQAILIMQFHNILNLPKSCFNWDGSTFSIRILNLTSISRTNFSYATKPDQQPITDLGPYFSVNGTNPTVADCDLKEEIVKVRLNQSQKETLNKNTKDMGFVVELYEMDSIRKEKIGTTLIPVSHFFEHKLSNNAPCDVQPQLSRSYVFMMTNEGRLTSRGRKTETSITVSLRIAYTVDETITRKPKPSRLQTLGLIQSERTKRENLRKTTFSKMFCAK